MVFFSAERNLMPGIIEFKKTPVIWSSWVTMIVLGKGYFYDMVIVQVEIYDQIDKTYLVR